jgi:hypothetical protein
VGFENKEYKLFCLLLGLLLQQHHINLFQQPMLAATLKGLILHTADEAGFADGPDYQFGWGLINAEKAANVLTNINQSSIILLI